MLQIAANYGGRWDITQAARARRRGAPVSSTPTTSMICICACHRAATCRILMFIRTGGELRISNFLLWHWLYRAVFYPVLWPDFDAEAFAAAALAELASRRRFGQTGRNAGGSPMLWQRVLTALVPIPWWWRDSESLTPDLALVLGGRWCSGAWEMDPVGQLDTGKSRSGFVGRRRLVAASWHYRGRHPLLIAWAMRSWPVVDADDRGVGQGAGEPLKVEDSGAD